MKILYIAGYGRSGTTLVDNVLGQVDGFFTVGELRYIWDRGIQKNWTCGCGQRFACCEFWKSVLRSAYNEDSQLMAKKMLSYRDPLKRIRSSIKRFNMGGDSSADTYNLEQFIFGLKHLYSTVHQLTGADLIIDSSKWASYGKYLTEIPGVELFMVHLVRDPRAVAFSWKRKRAYDPYLPVPYYIPRYPVVRTALEWIIWNFSIERMKEGLSTRYLLMRYEDFAKEPRSAVNTLLGFLGENHKTNPIRDGFTIDLDENHCVAGNPIRFQRGEMKIKLDEEWKFSLSTIENQMVRALTWGLMRKYGYLEPSNSLMMD
ncbi:MAG: sulfotransferase domain-containing protein [Desulfobacteraceae bacterium]|nr:sulfotransferase domain-containing protein [Desulfobacteraceae bacterium]